MWNMVVLILDNPAKLDEVLDSWEALGIRSATIIESSGLARRRGYLADDMPLFPSVASLLEGTTRNNLTLFTLVEDHLITVEEILASTERVVGALDEPERGVLFAIPLALVKGAHPPQPPKRR